MNRLIATVGLPRSGKTTFCNKVLKPRGFVIVNPDSFRIAMHGQRFLASAEPFVWAAVFAAVDALMIAGHDVVVDATNLTEKNREPWRARSAEFHLMGTTRLECIERAVKTNDGAIIGIINEMARTCDWPEAIGIGIGGTP